MRKLINKPIDLLNEEQNLGKSVTKRTYIKVEATMASVCLRLL